MQRKYVLNRGGAHRLVPHFLHTLHCAHSNPTWGERMIPRLTSPESSSGSPDVILAQKCCNTNPSGSPPEGVFSFFSKTH